MRATTSATQDEAEKGYTQMSTPGGNQSMAIVNEPGLYSMLFAMQPEKGRGVSDEYIAERQGEIKAFKRWITHEVIPSIRKTGVYSITPNSGKRLSIMEKNADARRAEDEKDGVGIPDAMGRTQLTTVISLPGLLRIVSKSRIPMAKEFQRWVYHEVLPFIYHTGYYKRSQSVSAPPEVDYQTAHLLEAKSITTLRSLRTDPLYNNHIPFSQQRNQAQEHQHHLFLYNIV